MSDYKIGQSTDKGFDPAAVKKALSAERNSALTNLVQQIAIWGGEERKRLQAELKWLEEVKKGVGLAAVTKGVGKKSTAKLASDIKNFYSSLPKAGK